MSEELLSVENLHVRFAVEDGEVHAVDGISLSLDRGEVLGIVGESGCGKSAFSMAIPRLLPMPPAKISADKIELCGLDLTKLADKDFYSIRGSKIGVIFQEPMTSLSPLHTIGDQIREAVLLHRTIGKAELDALVLDWLAKVGISDPARTAKALPHELSGGMQQRVMIAIALINDPDLIIADEPTTALDVTTQAQVLALMKKLKTEKSGLLLITHDMGVVRQMATKVAVMYAGQIIETASCDELFSNPLHPYTQALLAAMPSAATRGHRLPVIPGSVPSPLDWPAGCRFSNRCQFAAECKVSSSAQQMHEAAPCHFIRCAWR